jgi:xylulokinase
VRALSADLFGVPVVVPSAGEYVALGAARQAAWALTGELPRWEVGADDRSEPSGDERAVRSRERYLSLRAADLT